MKHTSFFTFHGSLNDFLPERNRGKTLVHGFRGKPSVKDSIEAWGIPHPEVGLILAGGLPVGFGHRLEPERHLDIYPHACHPLYEVSPLPPIRPAGPATFVLDVHLGNLARFLRMLGFDTRYTAVDPGDAGLARIARRDRRIVLTRDIGLLKRSAIIHGHWLRCTDVHNQLRDVVAYYSLLPELRPFTRCMQCNHPLHSVDKERVADRLPPRVQTAYRHFQMCLGCDRIYWQGSHYHYMKAMIDKIRCCEPEPLILPN